MFRATIIQSNAAARFVRVALLAISIAVAGASVSGAAGRDLRADHRPEGSGSVFASIEAAALDAMSSAYLTATPRDRRQLRVGTIYRVGKGYSYTAPRRAAASSPLMRQSVRYTLRSIDVASYVIESRSQRARSNEMPSDEEKRIVDELDPAHRPLFLLTSSLDVVRYSHGGVLRVIDNLDDPALANPASPVIAAIDTRFVAGARCPFRSTDPMLAR